MKKIIFSVIGIILAVLSATIALASAGNYRISKESAFVPYDGATDLYHASKDELAALDLCNYSGVFGSVPTEKEAAAIAAEIIADVYQTDESPYVIKLNEHADAWIVRGSLPPFHKGGVASVAIDRQTGEIIMLLHTK